ncbi:MAG: hydroxyacylglutathione hydrolase [Verrucomicrobia bacterium]|nr:MAG: hydroxyacylglutathione hydrolase [Verrucomicrobiota bacterium]
MSLTRFGFGDFEVLAVPVLHDNFVYLVCRAGEAVLIDAGEAKPVFQAVEENDLRLQKILITHTHHDHIGGCREIQDRLGVQSVSPAVESSEFPVLGTVCRSISTPGHMAVHKSYYFPELNVLFTGDTLINGACGRLLGGTAEQLFSSLRKICELPDETRIFGGHDYLVANMEFALSVEPGDEDVRARLELYRTDPAAAIFATLAEEKKTNPFLRVDTAREFAALRRRKDTF